ncbi:YHYH protein [Tabrizicola sp.]|uniref:YHYH protein n=1 Tax=Tabrizicola sp. TaxID=2005166 RepID=UPI003F2F9082
MKPGRLRPFAVLVASSLVVVSPALIGGIVLAQTKSDGTATDAAGARDITNAILTSRSADCADYATTYTSSVTDIQEQEPFSGAVAITADDGSCTLTSNNVPNHDFNDETARFARPVEEFAQALTIPRKPEIAAKPTALSHGSYNAVMLNGVVLDLLSAGCYRPDGGRTDEHGNVMIGCRATDPWLLDPLGPGASFGTDAHNAHTQPDGLYHYHGNPMALFDSEPGEDGSPVIGFAADGFPIYGSYFKDESGEVRKVVSGYVLRAGERPAKSDTDPGGAYDGMYVDDYEFTGAGDLDECNGMTVDGQYGYYVTDTYPWVMGCFSGTPDPSFAKRR